jgi:hypothetical protein
MNSVLNLALPENDLNFKIRVSLTAANGVAIMYFDKSSGFSHTRFGKQI